VDESIPGGGELVNGLPPTAGDWPGVPEICQNYATRDRTIAYKAIRGTAA
jgi:hypothetical protein